MRSIRPLRVAVGVGAVAASAAFWLMYMANGIAYGSLVGLKGRELDMQAMSSRATMAIIVAIVCQMLAWIMLVSGFHHAGGPNPLSRVKSWTVAISASLIATVAIIALFLYVNRIFKFV